MRMSSPVEQDEAPDPVDVGLLRPMAVVFEADSLPNDLQQPGMVSIIHVSDSLWYISPPDPGGTSSANQILTRSQPDYSTDMSQDVRTDSSFP